MPRGAAADDLIARGTRRASGVPRHSALDTLHSLKDCLHAPEAAAGEDSGLLARASGVGGSGGEVLAHHRAAGDRPSERHGRGEQRQTTTESVSHRDLHIGRREPPRAPAFRVVLWIGRGLLIWSSSLVLLHSLALKGEFALDASTLQANRSLPSRLTYRVWPITHTGCRRHRSVSSVKNDQTATRS